MSWTIDFSGARPVPPPRSRTGAGRNGRNEKRPYGPDSETASPTARCLNTQPSVHAPPGVRLICSSIRSGVAGVLATGIRTRVSIRHDELDVLPGVETQRPVERNEEASNVG